MCEKRLSVRWTVSPFVLLFALLLLMGISMEPVLARTWQIEAIDSAGDVDGPTSLALDPTTGYPRISYVDQANDKLKFAYYRSAWWPFWWSAWGIETVDSAGRVGLPSLALDPTTGHPRISYFDQRNSALKYASLQA